MIDSSKFRQGVALRILRLFLSGRGQSLARPPPLAPSTRPPKGRTNPRSPNPRGGLILKRTSLALWNSCRKFHTASNSFFSKWSHCFESLELPLAPSESAAVSSTRPSEISIPEMQYETYEAQSEVTLLNNLKPLNGNFFKETPNIENMLVQSPNTMPQDVEVTNLHPQSQNLHVSALYQAIFCVNTFFGSEMFFKSVLGVF